MNRPDSSDDHSTISELLRRHRAATGDAYSDIARKTGLSKALVGRLFTKTSPHRVQHATVVKLADGLGIPRHIVEAAALETAHVEYRPADMYAGRESVLLAQFATLPPPLQSALIDIAEALNRSCGSADHEVDGG